MNNKTYTDLPVFANRSVYPSNAAGITVIKEVNELFTYAIDYRSYCLSKHYA